MKEKEIIAQIQALKDEEINTWIEDRLTELENNTEENRKEISLLATQLRRMNNNFNNTEVHGFIPSTTRLKKMPVDMASVKIDDKSFYRTVVEYIKNSNEKYITNNNYIMNIIQCTIINYFGQSATHSKRNALYDSKSDINSDLTLSISDFKRNETAMCVERGAMGQNLLAFLGYDPLLIYGFASNDKGIINEGHVYNCIIRNNKGMLVDFTNPTFKDGKYYRPSCYPINSEKLENFIKGKAQVEVEHKDYITIGDEIQEDKTVYVYSSDQIDPKYFENKKEKIFSEEEIGKATINVPTEKKSEANKVNQIESEEIKDGEQLS